MSKVLIQICRSATSRKGHTALNKQNNRNIPETLHMCQADTYLEPFDCSHHGAEF